MSDNTQRSSGRRSHLSLALVGSALLVLLTAASVSAASPDTSTGTRIKNPAPFGDGAVRVSPNPRVVDLHRQAWDHITVSPNGKKLTVYFWNGVQACYGLGRVDVTQSSNGQLSVQLWTGIRPHAIGMLCVDLAQLYKTVIHLDRPIIGGGTF